MINNQIEILNNLSGVETNTPPNTDDIMGDYWVNRSEDILEKTNGMDPVERALTWDRETKDWGGWSANREYYWDTKYSLSPETDQIAKQSHINIETSVVSQMSNEEREYYFRDNAYKLPNHLFKHLEPIYNITDATLANKGVERSRINQELEFNELLNSKYEEFNKLSPSVSSETHAESIRLAYMNGYTEFSVDDSGFVIVPRDGKAVRAIDLKDVADISETIISRVDLTPIAMGYANTGVRNSRQEQITSERQALTALRMKITNPALKEEHKKSISVDYAMNISDNPREDLSKDIKDVIRTDLESGKIRSNKELANALYLYHKDISNIVKERI